MSGGLTLAGGLLLGGVAASVGTGIYGAVTQAGVAGQAESQSSTLFGEQQQYAAMLHNLIMNPSSVTSLPGYQFNLDQGTQAVTRAMGAGGYGGSGKEATALTQYAEGYATQAYATQAQLLAQLSGLPGNPNAGLNTTSSATTQSTNSLQQLLSSIGFLGGGGLNGLYKTPFSTTAQSGTGSPGLS